MLLRVFMVSFMLLLVANGQAAVSLALLSQVEVSRMSYTLADVAKVQCDATVDCRKLSSLTIGKTPRPGYFAHISRRDIQAQLRVAFPSLQQGLVWSGSEIVRIQSTGVALQGEMLTDAAREKLQEWLAESYQDFTLMPVQVTAMQRVPEGRVELQVKLIEGRGLSHRMPVWVDVLVDGQYFHSIPVWFAVTVMDKVLVAKNTLAAKSKILPEDFIEDYRDISLVKGNVFQQDKDLIGMRLTKKISHDEILKFSDVEWIPPVMKGEEVVVYATAGKVSIKTTGIAMHDGDLFQSVRIKGPSSLSAYNAVVIGDGQVKVD